MAAVGLAVAQVAKHVAHCATSIDVSKARGCSLTCCGPFIIYQPYAAQLAVPTDASANGTQATTRLIAARRAQHTSALIGASFDKVQATA